MQFMNSKKSNFGLHKTILGLCKTNKPPLSSSELSSMHAAYMSLLCFKSLNILTWVQNFTTWTLEHFKSRGIYLFKRQTVNFIQYNYNITLSHIMYQQRMRREPKSFFQFCNKQCRTSAFIFSTSSCHKVRAINYLFFPLLLPTGR